MAEALPQQFFLDQDTDILHGRVKRIMYKKYLQAFIPVTQQSGFNTVIVDGFAGAGRYGEDWPGEIDAYGSPLIALMVSLNYFFKKHHGNDVNWENVMAHVQLKPFTYVNCQPTPCNARISTYISLNFVEKNIHNFLKLKENIRRILISFFHVHVIPARTEVIDEGPLFTYRVLHPDYPIVCTLSNKSFQECTPSYIAHDTRCLTFADPFGYTHTPMAHVLKFCGPRSELLINLMSSYVNRFVSRNALGVAKLYGIDDEGFTAVAALFGIEPPDIENEDEIADFVSSIIRGDTEAGGNAQSCTKRYEDILKRNSGADYSLRFEMRGAGNQIIYHLIFLTHHMKGLTVMKESMNRCDQSAGEMKMSDYKVVRKGEVVILDNKQDDSKVADAIFHRFHSSTVSLETIEEYVWLETPYVYRKKPLKIMVDDERIIKVVDSDWLPPPMRGTFPGDSSRWTITFAPDDWLSCKFNTLSL